MKRFIPYIREFIIFIFVAMIIVLTLIFGNYINIIVTPHILSYLILVFLVFSVVFPYRKIIICGISAIFDCIFKTKREAVAVLDNIHQNYGSDFSDKFTGESARSFIREIRYIYVFKKGKNILLLKSTENFNLLLHKKYHITYGRFSKVIISISSQNT